MQKPPDNEKFKIKYWDSWEIYIQVKKQQSEPDVEQPTGSKSGKEYAKAIYCHPAF